MVSCNNLVSCIRVLTSGFPGACLSMDNYNSIPFNTVEKFVLWEVILSDK